jgi:hypothetical protein
VILPTQEPFYAKHFGFSTLATFKAGKPDEYIMLKLSSVQLELFPTDPPRANRLFGKVSRRRIFFNYYELLPDSSRKNEQRHLRADPMLRLRTPTL